MLFLSLIAVQLIVFAVLMYFLRSIFSRNITKATAHLGELNQDYTQKLEDANRRVQEAEKIFQETVQKAKLEADKAKAELLREAHQSQEMILSHARKQSEEIIEQGNNAREALLKDLEKKIEERSIEKACELMQGSLPEEIGRRMHVQWLEDLSKHGLEELDRLKLTDGITEAQVVTAYLLTAEQKEQLRKKIKDKVRRELFLVEHVDPQLIAGLKMTLGNVVIDGSLKFRISVMVKHAKRSSQN